MLKNTVLSLYSANSQRLIYFSRLHLELKGLIVDEQRNTDETFIRIVLDRFKNRFYDLWVTDDLLLRFAPDQDKNSYMYNEM